MGIISYINGPVIRAKNMSAFRMREMVMVGHNMFIGEIISLRWRYCDNTGI